MNIKMRRTLFIVVLLFGVAGAAFGQATLRVGDPLDIKIGGVPFEEQQQVNNTYTVNADGSVNLPYINKIKAAGLTPAQLARAIEESYRAIAGKKLVKELEAKGARPPRAAKRKSPGRKR